MITISAFADEIGPDLELQMDTCQANGIRRIDVRGIDDKNVSAMTLDEVREYRRRMDDRGFVVSCIGSPIGKIKIDDDFEAHLDLLKHCCDVAKAFGTDLIRIFSFYASDGMKIADQREAVIDRMRRMVEVAEAAGVVLLHENEKAIYGAKPEGVLDMFATIRSESFKGIFDPANYVEEGIAPYDEGWTRGLAELTFYFHIKDKNPGEPACAVAGRGRGQLPEILADLKKRNWSGTMALEPHLSSAEQFRGFTGPQLFAEAANALKTLCEEAGLEYQ